MEGGHNGRSQPRVDGNHGSMDWVIRFHHSSCIYMPRSERHGRFDGGEGRVCHVHFVILVLDSVVVHSHIVFCSHLHVHGPGLPVHRCIQDPIRGHTELPRGQLQLLRGRSPFHRCCCCEWLHWVSSRGHVHIPCWRHWGVVQHRRVVCFSRRKRRKYGQRHVTDAYRSYLLRIVLFPYR